MKSKKLTTEDVAHIKIELARGTPQPAVAAKFKTSRSTVSGIATNRTHKDVPWPIGEPSPKKPGGPRRAAPQFDPTNDRIRELEAEVSHLMDERNHARKAAQAGKREHGLFKAVVAEMDLRVKPFTRLPPARDLKPRKDTIVEHVVMHLSDGHHDQVITREESAGLEDYNFPISLRRAETYVDTVIDWTQQTLRPRFSFNALTVLAYGDHTSGEIHKAVQRSYFRNQFKNSFAIGQLHALMFRDLAPYFDNVNVVYVPGNHGRRSEKKDYHGAHDNWDYLIAKTAQMYCRDLDNVSFVIPDAFSINVEINGVGFNISHGDDVNSNSGIPFYGMVRRQKGLLALSPMLSGPRVRYFCMGHHHVQASLADLDGALIVNGAWPATDSYAFNRFSGYREPTQLIHGVNPKRGITWRMDVQLKTPDEAKGPRRYKVEV